MFISFLYMFRATMFPSSGEITVSSHPHGVTNTNCHIDTVISLEDGHIVARDMYRKEINILGKTVHHVGFIYKNPRDVKVFII